MNDTTDGARLRLAAALLAGFALAGCGGGGGGNDTSSTPPATKTPQTRTLSGSQGHPERYLGTWTSGCGMVVFNSGPVKSVQNTWKFSAVNVATVTGTFEQRQYSDTNCLTPWPSAAFTITGTAMLAVVSQTTLTPGTGSVVFAGTADQVQITLRQTGLAAETSVQHAAFEGETKLRFTQNLPFSVVDLEYDKR